MTKAIDAGRLRELRNREELSQQELAKRAKLTKGSLHRLEAGRQPGSRRRTLEGLAGALGVDPGVLTGEMPLPEAEPKHEAAGSQMNFRVNDAVRNAFWLASRGYGVPATRIVELAPYLFVCAAEASLERRRAKLAELRKLLEGDGAILSEFPHLPFNIVPSALYSREAIEAEKRSIAARKILADDLPAEIFPEYRGEDGGGREDRDYREASDNPFMRFLWDLQPADHDLAFVAAFDESHAMSTVRRDVAMELCCGDSDLADAVVYGGISLYKIPSALLEKDAAQDRVAWLRGRHAELKARSAELLADFDDQLPPEAAS